MPVLKELKKNPTLGSKVLDSEAMKDRERKSMYFGGKMK